MRLEQSFEVPVPVAQAWTVLLDLERVAPCMPGATLTGFDGSSFTGTVTVKLGPISLSYRGQGRITEKDEVGHRLAFIAQGQDSRGAGGASARVSAVLHPAGGGVATVVRVVTDLDISGKVAQYGQGMIADVSGRLIKQFADSLAATIGSAAPFASTSPASAPTPSEFAPPPLVAPIPTQAAPVDGVTPPAPPAPPPLAPIFGTSAPADSPPAFPPPADSPPPADPPPADSPLAADPPPPAFPPPPPGWAPAKPATTGWAPAKPATPEPETEYVAPMPAHSAPPEYLAVPEPPTAVASPSVGSPAAPPGSVEGTGLSQPPGQADPLDLLAVSGAKGVLRRAAPVLIIVALALAGLIVWLVAVK